MAVFFGGVPTGVDVDALMKRVGVPKANDLVTYQVIEETIKQKRGTHRFNSVITAWRNKLSREHNLLFEAVRNEGFRALDGHGRVGFAGKKLKYGTRQIKRALFVAESTDRTQLDHEDGRALDNIRHASMSVLLARSVAAKSLSYPEPEKK